jgi:hypothetical protein
LLLIRVFRFKPITVHEYYRIIYEGIISLIIHVFLLIQKLSRLSLR